MMIIPFALGSLIGASALNCFSALPHLHTILLFSAALLVATLLIGLTKKPILHKCCIALLGSIVGFNWAYFQATQRLSWQLPSEDIQERVTICGQVTGVSQRFEKALRFDVAISQYQGKPLNVNAKVRLFWPEATVDFTDKDNLCALVKLKPRWHLANPGTVDQEKQLFLEGIQATGSLILLNNYQRSSQYSLTRHRQNLNERIRDLLGDKPFLGVIQATTLGLYQNITAEQWRVFQATGTVHAIAISGLHISFVALLCGGLVTILVRRFPWMTTLYPAKFYGAIASIIGALIYAALAGFSIPTQRALIMILVVLLALLKRQPLLSWYGLAYAWIGIFLIDPLATLQVGFWLSFGCVGALIYGNSHTQSTNKWQKWVIPQLVVFVGLLPLCSYFFNQVPLLSPIANMLALPIIDLIVVPASLLGLLLMGISEKLAMLSFWVAHSALEIIWYVLEKLSLVSFAIWQQVQIPSFYLFLAFIAAIFLLAPKGLPGRWMSIIGFLPMILYQSPKPHDGECYFTLLDVGQGLAAVIQTSHHTLLYDAGPRYGKDDAGRRVIIPFLLTQDIDRLHKVIISHSDLDHRAGLQSLQSLPIDEIISSEPSRLILPAKQCLAGETWEWDGVRFTLLNPFSIEEKKRNNLSCVLKVSTANHSILLTGDIEQAAEEKLLHKYATDLKSSLLVVPHHGSLTSSSEAFVKAVSPKYALYPVGLANQYRFPKQRVLQRYEEVGAKNLLVSHTGALMFRLNDIEELTPPIHWRDTSGHYWHTKWKMEK